MNRLRIPVRFLPRFIVIAFLVPIPCRASPSQSAGAAPALSGSCASIASAFPTGSAGVREHCERFAPRNAELKVAGKVWDPALKNWMFLIRCARPQECIPFWLPIPNFAPNFRIPAASSKFAKPTIARQPLATIPHIKTMASPMPQPLIRPGQKTTLVWEQDGIRLEAAVVCLDQGGVGDRVRARLARGKIVHAVVVSRELLKVES